MRAGFSHRPPCENKTSREPTGPTRTGRGGDAGGTRARKRGNNKIARPRREASGGEGRRPPAAPCPRCDFVDSAREFSCLVRRHQLECNCQSSRLEDRTPPWRGGLDLVISVSSLGNAVLGGFSAISARRGERNQSSGFLILFSRCSVPAGGRAGEAAGGGERFQTNLLQVRFHPRCPIREARDIEMINDT